MLPNFFKSKDPIQHEEMYKKVLKFCESRNYEITFVDVGNEDLYSVYKIIPKDLDMTFRYTDPKVDENGTKWFRLAGIFDGQGYSRELLLDENENMKIMYYG